MEENQEATEIKELPEDKNTELVSPKPKDKKIEYSKQEIELQEEKNTLLPEDENNKNQEDIKHVGIEDNGEKKTQITKKTEEE